MVTTRFYLDCRGKEKGSPAPLKLCIFKDNVRALIPLNINLTPTEWDVKKQRPSCESLYAEICQRKAVIDSYIFKQETEGAFVGKKACQVKDMVMNHFFGTPRDVMPTHNNFKTRYEHFAMSRPAEGTRNLYNRTWLQIKKFARHKKFNLSRLTFEEIDVRWLKEFDSFLMPTSPSKNARNIHFRNIRAVFNDALEEEAITCYPFRKFKIKGEETPKRSLTVESLRTLFTCEVEGYAEFYRDMFKLIFFLIGINVVDLARLQTITADGRVEYKRAKTHKLYSIKVEPEAKAIIDKYRGNKNLLNIMERWTDYKNFARQTNIALQSIGAKRTGLGGKKGEGMFPGITTYWARHTWATIAADIDVPDAVISQALGHSTENKTTEIYIRRNRKKVDDANRRVIDFVMYGK